MNRAFAGVIVVALCIGSLGVVEKTPASPPSNPAPSSDASHAGAGAGAGWKQRAPWNDASFFPIAVWLQEPSNAAKFKQAGFNLYIGLWKGPTEEQLARLKKAQMPVMCSQNAVGLAHKEDGTIVGWTLPDEPDNAQEQKNPKTGKMGYGPPVKPADLLKAYEALHDADPARPVYLNLGQGVANAHWHGRGNAGKPQDYPQYARACDILSFDIYPIANAVDIGKGKPEDNLPLLGEGVSRLVQWTGGQKPVWNCLECTAIRGRDKPTPKQVKAEAWLAIVRGSRGLVFFVHQFKPKFDEHALLDDPEMLSGVTAMNRQIHDLAPILNTPVAAPGATVSSDKAAAPVEAVTIQSKGATYVFAVQPRDATVTATFKLPDGAAASAVQVIGEDRRVELKGGTFQDRFDPFAVHLYRVR